MRDSLLKYSGLLFLVSMISCSPPKDTTNSSGYSFGVLSSEVESYSDKEITLKLRYFLLDGTESDQLITRNIENNISISSSDIVGTLIDQKEIPTPYSGNYSCAVLLDEIYNIMNYDFWDVYTIPNSTEVFLRKFFKNAGNNNSFRFTSLKPGNSALTFYGKGYTQNAASLDIPLSEGLNDVSKPTSKFSNSPLLQNIYLLMDTINKTAPPGKKDLLLIYSRVSYINSGITKDSVINKALRLGIRVSTIMDAGVEYNVVDDWANEDLFYKLANLTGGFVYMDNDYTDFTDKLILASRLGNILEGNFKCFESTWKIVPQDIYTDLFRPGFYAGENLDVDVGTQFLSNVRETPFAIYIK